MKFPDQKWYETHWCELAQAQKGTFIGDFNGTGRVAICCAHCQVFIRWATPNEIVFAYGVK